MRQSRLEQLQGVALRERDEDGPAIVNPGEVHLPEINPAFSPILGFFVSAGQATSTGYGLVPLSWQEIKAWREENEIEVTLWERELIRRMSEAYCAEYSKASDPKRPAPYKPELEEEEIDHVGRALGFMEQLRLLQKPKEN